MRDVRRRYSNRVVEEAGAASGVSHSRLRAQRALSATDPCPPSRETSSSPSHNRPLLVRVDAGDVGCVFGLAQRCFTLGRHTKNAACIEHDSISRFHARITTIGDRYWLEDLHSSNGTFVNGRRVSACELRNGDMLQVGYDVSFRFTVATEHEEQALRRLYERSILDPLTAAFNRQYFAAQVQAEVAFAQRHGTPLSALLIDIDHFKTINDRFGHCVGDRVLQCFSARVRAQLREEDLLARYGGEEFVVLMRATELPLAVRVAERLRRSIEDEAVPGDGTSISFTVSIGCASLSCCHEPGSERLLRLADERLYQAKRLGRNRVVGS